MSKLLSAVILFLFFQTVRAQDPFFSGKIAVAYRDKVSILIDGKIHSRFGLLNTKTSKINLGPWRPGKDMFLGTLFTESTSEGTVSGSLVTIDIIGNILDTLYKAEPYEIIQHIMPSHNGKLLFTGFKRGKNSQSAYAVWFKPISFEIWNLENKKVLKRIDDFCPGMYLEILESPWSPDSRFLVYAVLGKQDRSVEVVGEWSAEPVDVRDRGIYIYDIENDRHKKILADGQHPIWSPAGNLIAYKKDNNVFCYDVETEKSYRVYKPKAYENLGWIHWAPDSRHIFLRSEREYFNLYPLYSYFEKWIDVKTKNVRKSQGPLIGRMNTMTWRK